MVATRGARTAYNSGTHDLTPSFSGVHVTQSSVMCEVFCLSFSFGHCIVCSALI